MTQFSSPRYAFKSEMEANIMLRGQFVPLHLMGRILEDRSPQRQKSKVVINIQILVY